VANGLSGVLVDFYRTWNLKIILKENFMGHYCLYILFTYSLLLIHVNFPPYVLRCTEKNLPAPHLVFTVLIPN